MFATLSVAGSASAQFTISYRSSPLFFIDAANPSPPGPLGAMYAVFQISNDSGSAVANPWVRLSTSNANVSLAENDNKYHLKNPGTGADEAFANGETKPAWFFLKTGLTGVTQDVYPTGCQGSNLTVTLYEGDPDTGGALVAGGSATFAITCVVATIGANANTVDSVVTLPNPLVPGAVGTMTVSGNTGTQGNGGTGDLQSVNFFTPASIVGWPADTYEFFKSSIEIASYSNNPYVNLLVIPKAEIILNGGFDRAYTAVYSFIAHSVLPGKPPVSPVLFANSGTQVKHTATGNFHTFTESNLYTLAPCRVADTRNPNGPSGGPALAANTVRSFPVGSLCGIPSSATAVAINLAVFSPSNNGDLRVYPAGSAAPLASSINFRSGIVRANNAIVPLGASGQITVQCDMPSGVTHFFFDVYGYFQ